MNDGIIAIFKKQDDHWASNFNTPFFSILEMDKLGKN